MRKTLEANMHMADLFPPGRVWWALRDQTLHPSNRIPDQPKGLNKLRLFEVLRVEQVFDQMEFAADMLMYVWLTFTPSYGAHPSLQFSYAPPL